MFLHIVSLVFFLGVALAAIAAVVSPYRAAMAVLRGNLALENTKRAASFEARPLPVVEPLPAQPVYGMGPVAAPVFEAAGPLGQPIRLRRQRRLRRSSLVQASAGLSWLQRQSLRFASQPLPAFAAAGGYSCAR